MVFDWNPIDPESLENKEIKYFKKMNKLLKTKIITNLIKSNNPLSSDSSFSIEENIIKLNMDDDKLEQKSGSVKLSRI